jgi:hypothetical protein
MNAHHKPHLTRLLLPLAMLLTALLIWQPAAAKPGDGIFAVGAGKTIALGKQGIFFGNQPKHVSHVYLERLSEGVPPRFGHDADISYRAPAMVVRFLNSNGGTVHSISAQAYVFFNIGKAERQLWHQQGQNGISIWYANESSGTWQRCGTHFVNENLDNGTYDRLACLAMGSGYYVLGHVDFDELLFNPYTDDNQKVIEFARKFVGD